MHPFDTRQTFEVIRDVVRAARLFQQENVYCGGVTFLQFTLLDHVAAAGGALELSELHTLLSVEKSTTTRLVDPLVRQGLLIREASERDPRARRVRLTALGESSHEQYWTCLSAGLRRALLGIDPAEVQAMVAGLMAFVRTVDAADAARSCG